MTILVVGATGATGRRIVETLDSEPALRVLVRSASKARELLPGRVDVYEGDVTRPETLAAALAGVSVVICATGARPGFGGGSPQQIDYEGVVNLVEAARTAAITHFVLVSSLCVSRLLHPLNLFGGVLYFKKRGEEHLIRSGLTFTIVRPGGLRDGVGGAEVVISPADTLFEGSIDRRDVARVCVEAVRHPGEASNRIVEIVAGNGPAQPSLAGLFAQLPSARPRVP